MNVQVSLNKLPITAVVEFAHKDAFAFVSDWKKSVINDSDQARLDAVEFAQSVHHKFLGHSEWQKYATSIEDIGVQISKDTEVEVPCCVLLTCDWFTASKVLGVSHFRRNWRNRIVLDYLATHPLSAKPPDAYPETVKGVGTALLYFISQVASQLKCDVIWGEATPVSRGYYEKVLELEKVEDLIYVEESKYLDFSKRTDAAWREKAASSGAPVAIDKVYDAETSNPPFVGRKIAMPGPTRRLILHFLDLPSYQQAEILLSLALVDELESQLPEQAALSLAIDRAFQRGKMGQLWSEVERRHPEGSTENNPFPTN